jgi:hypothetical protein
MYTQPRTFGRGAAYAEDTSNGEEEPHATAGFESGENNWIR